MLYAITSTNSAVKDTGADPNMLVAISDTLAYSTALQAAGESFATLQAASEGTVLRGVAFAPVAPVPLPAGAWLFISGLAGVFALSRRGRSSVRLSNGLASSLA